MTEELLDKFVSFLTILVLKNKLKYYLHLIQVLKDLFWKNIIHGSLESKFLVSDS